MGIVTHALAIAFGAFLHVIWKEKFEPKLDNVVNRRARERHAKKVLPDPPLGFGMFRLGNIELPFAVLFGTPQEPLSIENVVVDYEPLLSHDKEHFPKALKDAIPYLLDIYFAKYPGGTSNNYLARLSDIDQAGETQHDGRGKVTLKFEQTNYNTFLATNRSLDHAVIPSGGLVARFRTNETLRQAYVRFPYDLSKSILANPLGVNVLVISRNLNQTPQNQVLVKKRSKKVALYRGFYQGSAAGFVNSEAHCDEKGRPNVFATAVDEAKQEVADMLVLDPSAFKLIGIGINWEDLDLNAYGYVETGIPAAELVADHARDSYEGTKEALPFDPVAILEHVSKNRWEASGAMCILAALLAHFNREQVEAAAMKVPAKKWRKFTEDS